MVADTLNLPSNVGKVFESTDVDAFREEITRRIAPHIVQPGGRAPLSARYAGLEVGGLAVFQIGYGAPVRIDAEGCGDNFLVKVAVRGSARIRSNGGDVDTGASLAAVLNPDRPLTFDYAQDCQHLVIGLASKRIERRCAELLGEHGSDPKVRFDLGMSLEGEAGRRWLRTIAFLRGELADDAASFVGGSDLALAPLGQMLATTLLLGQHHNLSDRLARPVSPAAPRHVVRAEAYMEAHLQDPITPADIAKHAGVSERALFRGFQSFRGMTPMVHLRALRMRKVHKELLAGEPGVTFVTETALRWGFTHLGHFGQAYRAAYGETPAQTLQRTR